MSAIDVAAVMDDLAGAAPDGWHGYAYQTDSIVEPAMVVGLPEIEVGVTFGRGSDHATFPVWFLIGKVMNKAARDRFSAIVAGADDMVAALADVAGQVTVVMRITLDTVVVTGIAYLGARFEVEVWS